MSFYARTHRALHEADEERLRRLAAMGDPAARAEVARLDRRGSSATEFWTGVARKWTSQVPGLDINAPSEPLLAPAAVVMLSSSRGIAQLLVRVFWPEGASGWNYRSIWYSLSEGYVTLEAGDQYWPSDSAWPARARLLMGQLQRDAHAPGEARTEAAFLEIFNRLLPL